MEEIERCPRCKGHGVLNKRGICENCVEELDVKFDGVEI